MIDVFGECHHLVGGLCQVFIETSTSHTQGADEWGSLDALWERG